jgi:Na+-driven multidrug efflux pump
MQEHYVQAGTAIRNALVFSIVFGALMALVLAAFNQPILTVMGCTEKTMAAGREYFLTRVW